MEPLPSPSSISPSAEAPPRPAWYSWKRIGLNILTLSILAHLFFGVLATYFVVQRIQAKRQQNFSSAPQSHASERAVEHKVQLQKQRNMMSAPASLKRVVTTADSRISLPAMPVMPSMKTSVTPMVMAGMSSTGLGMGGMGGVGGRSGGGGVTLFGLRGSGTGLEGHFCDLKQTTSGQPISMDASLYYQELTKFVKGGWNDATLAKYFHAPNALYATQLYIPTLDAEEGPAAFNVADKVKADFTAVHYKGRVTAGTSGRYRFVGYGDNVLVVRFDHRVVLDCGSGAPSGMKLTEYWAMDGETVPDSPGSGPWYHGSGVGTWFDVTANQTYDMEILIGEEGGGLSAYFLQVQKDGDAYEKDSKGHPILPVFKLSSDEIKLPPKGEGHIGEAPVFAKTGPLWRSVAGPPAFNN